MNQETANYIMQRMSKYLDNSQMIKLKDTLDESLRQSEDEILEKSSQELLDMFLATKRLEGRSEKTLFLYRFNIEKMPETYTLKSVNAWPSEREISIYLIKFEFVETGF